MATKKDFSNIETAPVHNQIAEALGTNAEAETPGKRKPRKTYTEDEAREAMNNMHTIGKKGVKMPRINLAFTPNNYDYVKAMARIQGRTMTEFINAVLDLSREKNDALYKNALRTINEMK